MQHIFEHNFEHILLPESPKKKKAKIEETQYCQSDLQLLHSSISDHAGKGNSSSSCTVVSASICKEESPPGFSRSAAEISACPSDPSKSPHEATSLKLTQDKTGKDQLPDDFLEPLPIFGDPRSDLNSNMNCIGISGADRNHHRVIPAPILNTQNILPQQRLALTVNQTISRGSRQFWKAGDYEGKPNSSLITSVAGGIDHVRVHPKFLHSNATSHKWALGAIAELLDNALDEVSNGATFVNVDMLSNPRDGGPMLIFEDNGGGMHPDRMRQCMSLGYSAKSKRANTIGQYGNGFKTSTMRLGSDVIVFSRSQASKEAPSTQSIGLLSYSFLRDTCQEDIIVPMIDYEIRPFGLKKLVRSCVDDWDCNMDTIMNWSPFSTESDLLNQFSGMKSQGTKIVLFNLWEDDQGQLELDFESDPYDIQVRGANRDEKKIAMAQRFPNSRHYLTYRHSLRSYASILYLRLPQGFRIILRGKDVVHHSLVNDLMFTQEHTYKPHGGVDNIQKESNMMAVVTIGFVKDAKEHVDVQGFNVYHKNRLIKPFWRIWNSSSSQGRGIIGVLEANFVEPAHDKQGFEKTTVLTRLETRLLQMQKAYWLNCCHLIGYHSSKAMKESKMSSQLAQSIRSDKPAATGKWKLITGKSVTKKQASYNAMPNQVQNSQTRNEQISMQHEHTLQDPNQQQNSPVRNQHTSSVQNQHVSPIRTLHMRNHYTSQMPPPSFRTSSSTPRSNYEFEQFNDKKDTNFLNGNGIEPNSLTYNSVRSSIRRNEGDQSLVNARNEVDVHKFLEEVEKNKQLEAKVSGLTKKMEEIKATLQVVAQERDKLKQRLEEEFEQRSLEDEDLRKKLKEAYLRIKQLESANSSIIC